ncbi:MAG TPA: hypothetical protein VFA18_02425 [Gemmataceae bacterium]|nr:hypothetical protein [Gemmataceae bacterium]
MRPEQALTNEQLQQQGREAQRSWSERIKQWIEDNHARQPALGAELAAMGREAIKDVRGTLMESYFGKPEHVSEPGTPLSPTMQEVSADRGLVGQYQAILDSYAGRGSVHGHEHGNQLER